MAKVGLLFSAEDRVFFPSRFQTAWHNMFAGSLYQSPNDACILPEKVDLLERLFRSALHIRQSQPLTWTLSHPGVRTAIQSFPAPTLQWEAAATALLWHYGIFTDKGDFEATTVARKACAVVRCLMSEPRETETRLPVIVWEDLLAAASSCPSIPRPDLSDPVYYLNDMITNELTRRVRFGRRESSDMYYDIHPISFEGALYASENFVWSLLSPFDKYQGNALDSTKVQRLLSLVNAIVSRGLYEVSSGIFFGTCKELICELQAGSVTLKDQEAICVAADTLLQERTADFGPNTVFFPSLLFLHCWTPHATVRSTRNAVLLDLIEMDMFQTLHEIEDIEVWLWSSPHTNNTAPVASLVVTLIHSSFEPRMGAGAELEDSRWLEYLCLPANSATIVSLVAFQGTTQTPASVAQVRDDLLHFFSSHSLDWDTLQECWTSLDVYLRTFVPYHWRDQYTANVKEAKKVIDELISKQSPKPETVFNRLLRRARKSPDPEAIITQAE
ncbi:hypothetical protein BDZ89DRAFT_1081087 [Hymenopellis radicata]|nr:hypothetical protein BDZ89DRAFT_1081087 [Hymenopellis radicata]